MSIEIPAHFTHETYSTALKLIHFDLWAKMEQAKAQHVEIYTRFEPRYIALSELSAEEAEPLIEKLVEEEIAAGRPEASKKYFESVYAIFDNAAKIIQLDYPEAWVEVSHLFEKDNRLIYMNRLLGILAKMKFN